MASRFRLRHLLHRLLLRRQISSMGNEVASATEDSEAEAEGTIEAASIEEGHTVKMELSRRDP